jgi:hypothetical protein
MSRPRHRLRTTPEDHRLLVRSLEMELADLERHRNACVERLAKVMEAIVSVRKRLAAAREADKGGRRTT